MPDTVRLLPALQALLADNVAGDISPQDVRDFLVSTYRDYIKVSDVKAANTPGGTFTSAAWRTRDINTEDSDAGGHAAIAANQITLQPGEYVCVASAPAVLCSRHKLRLQNITAGSTTIIGTSEYAIFGGGNGAMNRSFVAGLFSIGAATVFEIQHRCVTTRATDGLGKESNFAVSEVYAVAEFWWRTP